MILSLVSACMSVPKLYVIKDPKNNYYSEQNFSLGERLLLNSLDFIEKIKERSLLLIDEVELALHPIAQIKFYDYLTKIAKEKKINSNTIDPF